MCRVLFFNHKPTEQSESERRMLGALDATYMTDPCLGSRRRVVNAEHSRRERVARLSRG